MTEDGIIAAILARCPHPGAPAGPGDDAAVLSAPPPGTTRVLTIDALVEGTHFLRAHPPEALGWKALAVNLSDVAAMGARPEAFALALAVPDGLDPAWLDALARGLGACATAHGVLLVGGDTVRGTSLMLTITTWGVVAGAPLTRAGGRPGDVLMVAGAVGRSGVGLARWLADPRPDRPELARLDAHPLLAAHLRPEPPLAAGPRAHTLGAHAAMDLSDGLATDLPRLAAASRVTLVVDLDALPADPALAGVDARERAAGGEDYGLVVLAPPEVAPALCEAGFAAIGRALAADDAGPRPRRVVWREHGREVADVAPGFVHFASPHDA